MLGATGRVLGCAGGDQWGSGPVLWGLAVPYAGSSYCATAPQCDPITVYE